MDTPEQRPEHADDPRRRSGLDLDAAVTRLEDVLLSLPHDRALPDLADLLDRAGVPAELLRRDDRALKVLHEAVLSRPFATLDEVHRVRVEVDLLHLEVDVLAERIGDPTSSPEVVDRATRRLAEVRDRVTGLRRLL